MVGLWPDIWHIVDVESEYTTVPPKKYLNSTAKRKIELTGALNITGQIEFATTDILLAIKAANIIMIATTATAYHKEIAIKIAKHLEHNQIIVLNPGRTGEL